MLRKRSSGILLHISSLAGDYGIGDFGPGAYKFVDFLNRAGQRYWQILPVTAGGYSPYDCLSAFAGNTLLISPELLYREGLLSSKEVGSKPQQAATKVDYPSVSVYKKKLLKAAFKRFKGWQCKDEYERFCLENESWLEDFAMFIALRHRFGRRCWGDWPIELRDRKKWALKSVKSELAEDIEEEKFGQYFFFKQWDALKSYCKSKGVKIIGDIPIYVSYNSSDVWSHPGIFKLTGERKPRFVTGVPPDCFSRTGQLWGHPVYNWAALKVRGYQWWLDRIGHNLDMFDLVRLDHFRAFVAYWQVLGSEKTAQNGKWVAGPKEDFFRVVLKDFASKNFIVEDLGHITDDVRAIIEKFRFAGMRIIQYGFDAEPATNPHCLHNHVRNSVVFTGTHDNNTVRGWFEKEASAEQKKRLVGYLGTKISAEKISQELIRLAMSSVSNTVIIAMQDILGLDETARMNLPGSIKGNWSWRLGPDQLTGRQVRKLAKLTKIFGRS